MTLDKYVTYLFSYLLVYLERCQASGDFWTEPVDDLSRRQSVGLYCSTVHVRHCTLVITQLDADTRLTVLWTVEC